MDDLSDNEVFNLVKAGHPEAFEEITARYQGLIKGFIKKNLGIWDSTQREEVAQDLTQNVLMKVFERCHKHREGNFRGWILTIASNEVKNWKRSCGRGEKAIVRFIGLQNPGYEEDVETTVLLREKLRESIDALKDVVGEAGDKKKLLAVIFSLIILGWGFYEIHAYIKKKGLTDMNLGAFKLFLFRARQRIKKRIEKNQE